MSAPMLTARFRVAAGPRIGFGHLIRCRSLAAALGVAPRASVRATATTCAAAARLGVAVDGNAMISLEAATGPRILIVDDPSAVHAGAWVRRARRAGVPVAAIHDLGLGYVPSDLGIDGSVRPSRTMRGRAGDLRGPAHAILDPAITEWRDRRAATERSLPPCRVLIALGGGSHVLQIAGELSAAVVTAFPSAQVVIAAGFTRSGGLPRLPHATWLHAPDGLAAALAGTTVAVVAGGLTLYEACAIGVPAVATALTGAQSLTIRAIADAGAAADGGPVEAGIRRIAGHVAHLLRAPREQRRMAAAGRALVDGRGVFRVADRLRDLAERGGHARHAA